MDEMLKSVVVSSANDCATARHGACGGQRERVRRHDESARAGAGPARYEFRQLHGAGRCAGSGRTPDNGARHRRDLTGASETRPHPRLHDHLDGHGARRQIRPFEHEQARALLSGHDRSEDGLYLGRGALPRRLGQARRDRAHRRRAALAPAPQTAFPPPRPCWTTALPTMPSSRPRCPSRCSGCPVTLGQKAAVQPELQQAAPILIEKGLQAAVTRTVTLAERVEAPSPRASSSAR